jgi:hypothetical protein
MFRKRNYLVVLARLSGPDTTNVETKPVYVQARTEKSAKMKAILETPGLWNVSSVNRVKSV